ncbi:MAG: efflux RND transporter permease subunit, partial [Synechococcales cyanobacterium]
GIIRQVGANVPAVSRGVRQVIAQTQSELDRLNLGVQFSYNYDESDYITQAVSLVQQNLFSGALLAVLILILFLGSMRTVAVVALTIPTSLVSVFIIMAFTGRTLNIISLAALGFASGMVVDSAIVVIENIFTHLQQGKGPVRAAIDGTHEVWGALVGSSLTNVAVFLPLALVQGEVAQLFIDMTITMTAATGFSLLSAITIVPM